MAKCRAGEIALSDYQCDRTFDLDVGFVHAPAAVDRAFVLAGQFLNQRQEANSPPVDRRMVDRHAALLHDLFQVPVAQRVSHVPANADQYHIDRETHPFEIEHVDSSSVRASQFTRSPCCLLTRHNPMTCCPCLDAPRYTQLDSKPISRRVLMV